jgi:ribose-phosphate pyrophosphokinase
LIPAFEGSNPSSPAIKFGQLDRLNIKYKSRQRKTNRVTHCGFLFFQRIMSASLFQREARSQEIHMALDNLMVFTGNANPALARDVAAKLGVPLGKANVSKFSDGEVMVEINENVRGKDVFVLQSTCVPTNDNLMEIMLMVDALKRASAGRISAAIPYFGYARQDRRPRSARVAISAKVVANMLQEAGVERVLIMDLHADQIQGFFDIPVDNIYASPILLTDLIDKNYDDLLVVSPDIGGVVRARALAKKLHCDLAIIDKRRPKANVSEVMNIIGEVEGRNCVIMDDMVDTAGTLTKAAEVLKERGAKKVVAYCTHPVLSGPAIDRINNSPLDELVVTDTIPLTDAAKACSKIRQLSSAALLAETFRRISTGDSVMSLFAEND